jgi:glycosyltransferase involved in cell wall biosynthesis
MACFDIFFLSSREDPHPLVMIEASLNKIPIVCFANSGGGPNYVENDSRVIIPYSNIVAAQNKLDYLLENKEIRDEIGARMYSKALKYDSAIVGPKVLDIIQEVTSQTTVL